MHVLDNEKERAETDSRIPHECYERCSEHIHYLSGEGVEIDLTVAFVFFPRCAPRKKEAQGILGIFGHCPIGFKPCQPTRLQGAKKGW